MSLDFIQIIYNEEHKKELYPFSVAYASVGLTTFFENSIIAGVVPLLQSDFIGVTSWRLRFKRGQGYAPIIIKDLDLTEEKIISQDADVCILTPSRQSHQPLFMAAQWHGQAWVDAFHVFKGFLSDIGITVPNELTNTIYENHFVARKEIYHSYVKDVLIPACHFMDSQPIFMAPSGYIHKKRDPKEIKRVQDMLRMPDWPIAPFILERLFSIYIEGKGLKIVPC
jgi:hypothetical protein